MITVLICFFRRHFDLTSPSVSKTKEEVFSCPLCVKNFKLASDLELHVNIEHRDILSPASPPTRACPVCGISLDGEDNVSKFHFLSQFPSVLKENVNNKHCVEDKFVKKIHFMLLL